MEKKVIDWALENGYLETPEEADTLCEIGIDIVEGAYEYLNGLATVEHNPVITLESGERVFGKPYHAYIGESYEDVMIREAKEKIRK